MEITTKEADKLREILTFYRKQIVNYGLPDRKVYRDFLIEMEQRLANSSNDIQNVSGLFDANLMNRIRATQTDAEARRLIMSAINKR